MTNEERLSRWRLILGRESEQRFDSMGGAPLSPGATFCDQCGAAQGPAGVCARCGYRFQKPGRFCPQCGAKREDVQ